ncbi:related to NEFA-interacting nuclear protein NIP30 [Ustilago trichophora]|uniref:Related to NEFA-interacting nuclear protein NIP30 n=1 Tax=Ustilago trichophora TaxID=86804 RepID=A0A5C3EIT7_9BASI|nr:related to NEFA-interacting nuclear protein NIP30 [Ustilago trichophora]
MTSKPSSSSVSSRFVSQSDLEAARTSSNRSSSSAEDYDPRSLFEKLQANKQEKDAKYDEMYKLSNQFRGIDEGESEFLAQVKEMKRKEEMERLRREREEVELFRAAKANSGGIGSDDQRLIQNSKLISDKQDAVKAQDDDGSTKDKTTAGGKVLSKKRKSNTSTLLGVVKKKNKPATAPTAIAIAENMAKSTSSTAQPPEVAAKSPSSSSTATSQTDKAEEKAKKT